jgi:hypothetical protein
LTVGLIRSSHTWCSLSAWAGPAKPIKAAAKPLATTVTIPNLFIVVPSSSCFSGGSSRAGLTV